jgi:hypothetical protein
VAIDRIVAAAERTPHIVTVAPRRPAPMSPQAVAGRDGTVVPLPARRSSFAWTSTSDIRRSFAVLAASLVLGLSIGQSGLLDRALVGLEDLTGVVIAPASQEFASALSIEATGDEF